MSTEPSLADLRVSSLQAWHGQAHVLHDVTIDVPSGTVVALFGHNGAGKSTLLRSIAGVHRQCSGHISIGGEQVDTRPAHRVAQLGLVLVREGAKVFDTMTVAEHLALGRRLAGKGGRVPRTADEIFDLFPALAHRRTEQAGYLSGGQRQMLALGSAFASAPCCLLLDEPSAGLAPSVAEEIYTKVAELSAQGVAVLVAEQNDTWLQDVADRGYLLETGRIVLGVGIEELIARTHVSG